MNASQRRGMALAAALWVVPACLAWAVTEISDLSKRMLYGDQPTRLEAVKEFNKLPSEAQYKLVPDFMVAMTDENPEVRKVASRILKAMGVTTEGQIPDAKKALPATAPSPTGDDKDKWAEEKKMDQESEDHLADLKKMKTDEDDHYAGLKDELDAEKKGQVTLDASQLSSDTDNTASPMSSIVESLKDPDPWVRQQAARRLPFVHPAPLEAIPLLVKMLGDKEPESRRQAAAALGSLGPLAKSAIPSLDAALSDPDSGVRQIAAESLQVIKQTQ